MWASEKLISSNSITNRRPKKWWSLLMHNNLVWTLAIIILQSQFAQGEKKVKLIYGVNAGGPAHTDVFGFHYLKDPLAGSDIGIASDYGNRLNTIRRTYPQDEPLYRTERYSEASFGYDIPIPEDGEYVLVLKFAEVYFQRAGQKVFDVELNRKHLVVSDLDIYKEVGLGAAHQEIVSFTVKDGVKNLVVNGEKSPIKKNLIRLEFLKGPYDNPKINAFYVIQGTVDDIPPLPADDENQGDMDVEEFEEDEDDEGDMNLDGIPKTKDNIQNTPGQRRYQRSGHSLNDPWENESIWSAFGPLGIALSVSLVLLGITVKFFRGV